MTALVAFSYAAVVIFKKIVCGDPVPEYPSLVVIILFLAGVQLIGLGIIGEYLGRMFDETKQRPRIREGLPAGARPIVRSPGLPAATIS